MKPPTSDGKLELAGLDGSNPLAFLAAVGTLRVLTLGMPDSDVRLGWRKSNGAWRPAISAAEGLAPDFVIDRLFNQLSTMRDHPALSRWDNLAVRADDFRAYAVQAVAAATSEDRIWADYAAAFACETTITADRKAPVVQDTAFRTMGGAGHQDFLGFMRNIIQITEREHLSTALFDEWRYDDPSVNSTLRWDPADDVRHALRWRNPSGDPARNAGGTMLGANRLAIEALPLFPVAPIRTRLETTGFSGSGKGGTFWSWPIWSPAIGLDVCRSLLALEELQRDTPDRTLHALGIVAAFRSQRITEGKYRNFTPARALC
ncbi:MAG: type I-G CRISPR-associated protein, Cas3-extension family [Vicinamibacterales bacterium]